MKMKMEFKLNTKDIEDTVIVCGGFSKAVHYDLLQSQSIRSREISKVILSIGTRFKESRASTKWQLYTPFVSYGLLWVSVCCHNISIPVFIYNFSSVLPVAEWLLAVIEITDGYYQAHKIEDL